MNTSDKHTPTPTPWHVHKTGLNDNGFPGLTIQSDFGLIVRMPDENGESERESGAQYDPENEANAELICRAVNSHAELLEALRMLYNIATHPKATKAEIQMIARESGAVLARAERA